MSPQPEAQKPNERRALLQAVAAQQSLIQDLQRSARSDRAVINQIASLAGLNVTALRKQADQDNPAQPVPNPPSENAAESTQDAVTPEARDDVRNPGLTPGSVTHLPADTTTVALQPGEALPTNTTNELENVAAPVAGTETHVPDEQTRIETDVRVGDPMNPQVAYEWNDNMGPNQSNGGTTASLNTEGRTFASIRLARLQIAAGLVSDTDDLMLGTKIASSAATDAEIESTIKTLDSVSKAANRQQARPANLVPRTASAVQRTTPSMASTGAPSLVVTSALSEETSDSDLFD